MRALASLGLPLVVVIPLAGCGGDTLEVSTGAPGLVVDPDDDLPDGGLEDSPPIASFIATPTTGIAPLSVSFDASLSSDPEGLIFDFRWDFGDGSSGAGVTPFHTYTTPGEYIARLTVTDRAGQKDTAVQLITVTGFGDDNLPPSAAFAATPSGGAAPLTVSFDGRLATDVDGFITRYQWDFGDGTTGFGLTASHVYVVPGEYQVTLTVTDDDGATGLTSTVIPVTDPADDAVGPLFRGPATGR